MGAITLKSMKTEAILQEDNSVDNAFQLAKQRYEDAERNRAEKLHAYRLSDDEVKMAFRQLELLCPHKNMKGIFFKECADCSYSKFLF